MGDIETVSLCRYTLCVCPLVHVRLCECVCVVHGPVLVQPLQAFLSSCSCERSSKVHICKSLQGQSGPVLSVKIEDRKEVGGWVTVGGESSLSLWGGGGRLGSGVLVKTLNSSLFCLLTNTE